jgi:hypothetical protein
MHNSLTADELSPASVRDYRVGEIIVYISRSSLPFGLHVVLGPEFAGMAANFSRNLREGRSGLTQAIVRA